MANAVRPIVPVELDKTRHLKLDINAMIAFEDATGRALASLSDGSSLGMKEMRALMWACLLHEDAEITQEQVGSMIDMGNVEEVMEALSRVQKLSAPKAQNGGSQRPPKRSNG